MTIISSISTALTATLKDSDLQGVTAEWSEVFLDTLFADGLLKDIPIISSIIGLGKTGLKVTDTLFLKKLLYMIARINEIPSKEREKVINEIDQSKKYRIKIGEKLLYIVDKCDDHERAEIIGIMFKAFLERKLEYHHFLNCAKVIEQCQIEELGNFVLAKANSYAIQEYSDYLIWGLVEFEAFNIELQEQNHYGNKEYRLNNSKLELSPTWAGIKLRELLNEYFEKDIE